MLWGGAAPSSKARAARRKCGASSWRGPHPRDGQPCLIHVRVISLAAQRSDLAVPAPWRIEVDDVGRPRVLHKGQKEGSEWTRKGSEWTRKGSGRPRKGSGWTRKGGEK